MSTETQPQIVIIRKKSRRKFALPWLAGALGLALLASGGTYALWRGSSIFGGGQVTAGDLDLSPCTKLDWYDISPDRTDIGTGGVDSAYPILSDKYDGIIDFSQFRPVSDLTYTRAFLRSRVLAVNPAANWGGATPAEYPLEYVNYMDVKAHVINDISTWRMVPGDTVLAVCSDMIVTLEGDNLVAELALVNSAGELINTTYNGVAVWPIMFVPDETGDPRGYNPTPGGPIARFSAPRGGQASGSSSQDLSSTPNVVELAAAHDGGADGRHGGAGSGYEDLRTATVSDGRDSLGQTRAAVVFLIHFLDDGLPGLLAGGNCYADGDSGHTTPLAAPYNTALGCMNKKGYTWVPDGSTVAVPYTDKGNGDIGVSNSRYLATRALNDLINGTFVLNQIREPGIGTYAGLGGGGIPPVLLGPSDKISASSCSGSPLVCDFTPGKFNGATPADITQLQAWFPKICFTGSYESTVHACGPTAGAWASKDYVKLDNSTCWYWDGNDWEVNTPCGSAH